MSRTGAVLRERLQRAGVALLPDAAHRLERYLDLLLEANREVNLVSRREATREVLLERHVLDALEALPFLPSPTGRKTRFLDVGSGGGFPAVPLLLARPDLEGWLVESVGKKARFLERVTTDLGLTARVLNARFPDPALKLMRNAGLCDLLTSRAVAEAGEIAKRARPALAPGAVALLWTTEPLVGGLKDALPGARVTFRRSPVAETRGIARVERFT